MASQLKFTICAAYYFLLFVINLAAAHEVHHHTPGMVMSPGPAPSSHPSQTSFTYPSMIVGILGLILSSFALISIKRL